MQPTCNQRRFDAGKICLFLSENEQEAALMEHVKSICIAALNCQGNAKKLCRSAAPP